MVGVVGAVPTLDLLQEVAELLFIKVVVSNEASLLVQVKGQHRQRPAGSCISKGKDVKLPVALCILQHNRAFLFSIHSANDISTSTITSTPSDFTHSCANDSQNVDSTSNCVCQEPLLLRPALPRALQDISPTREAGISVEVRVWVSHKTPRQGPPPFQNPTLRWRSIAGVMSAGMNIALPNALPPVLKDLNSCASSAGTATTLPCSSRHTKHHCKQARKTLIKRHCCSWLMPLICSFTAMAGWLLSLFSTRQHSRSMRSEKESRKARGS